MYDVQKQVKVLFLNFFTRQSKWRRGKVQQFSFQKHLKIPKHFFKTKNPRFQKNLQLRNWIGILESTNFGVEIKSTFEILKVVSKTPLRPWDLTTMKQTDLCNRGILAIASSQPPAYFTLQKQLKGHKIKCSAA